MMLGAFSISLAVKDIVASKAFYEKLGFIPFGGNEEQKWLIMKNQNAIIGLFEGMFENNIITFNPGWNENAQNLDTYDDVRMIQRKLQAAGINLTNSTDLNGVGPAFITLTDPDGNEILIDQHR